MGGGQQPAIGRNSGAAARPNKAMKQTRLSAAPGRQAVDVVADGAASCPRRRKTAGTASQLIASVRRTQARRAFAAAAGGA